jgi:uncharacterized phiE125 gp8 family phage protein
VVSYPLDLVTGPTIEPIDLNLTKKQVRIPGLFSEDALIDNWIGSAREYFEAETGRQVMSATWEQWRPGFPSWCLELPKPPLQSIVSVQYVDTGGTLQTWDASNYTVVAPRGPRCARGYIEPVYGSYWPTTRCQAKAVRVRFVAGYGDARADVPDLVKSALYMLVAHLWTNREAVVALLGGQWSDMPVGSKDFIRKFVSRASGIECEGY